MTDDRPNVLDYARFEALTFDTYGTLIDWETGILGGLRPVLARAGVPESVAPDEVLLEAFAAAEARIEAGPYRRYRDVLAEVFDEVAGRWGVAPTADERARFGGSVVDWPAFPDSAEALDRLASRFRLGVITNCDDDLFAASARRLGEPFTWVVTAQQLGSYKPAERNFELALDRIGLPRELVLHVAQSLFHDHVPAQRLGFSSVWIDRRRGRDGGGATAPAGDVEVDAAFPDMASFADAALA